MKRPRLAQLGEHAFEWAFALGFVLIGAMKVFIRERPIAGGIIASIVGVAIMWLYVFQQRRYRSEAEWPRLGDEVYYLGLLYTLTSLCAALINLFLLEGNGQTIEQRTDEMIGSFGIALLTTMFGIVMRMPLQRQRAEPRSTTIRISHSGKRTVPGEIDSLGGSGNGVAIDLERHAYELRKQLQNSTNAFASHTNQAILQAKAAHAHMDDMMDAFHSGLEAKAKAQLARLESTWEAVGEEARKVAQRMEGQQVAIEAVLKKLETQIAGMDGAIERVGSNGGEAARHLGTLSVQVQASAQALEETGKIVRQGMNALAEVAAKEKAYQEDRAQVTKQMDHTLDKQAEQWSRVQQQAGEMLNELSDSHNAIVQLGREARSTNKELATFPDGLRKVRSTVEVLADFSSAVGELPNLGALSQAVAVQLSALADAGERYERALESAMSNLQTLAGVAGYQFEGLEGMKGAVADMSDVANTLAKVIEGIGGTEKEVRLINTELGSVKDEMHKEGIQLANVLKKAILAFEEAKGGKEETTSLLDRIFRP